MDSTAELAAARKGFTLNGGRKRPLELVREFRMQRRFPSTTKQGPKSDASNPTRPDSAENRVPHSLRKLRILSPHGRDLGEFDVELRSAGASRGNVITIARSSLKPVDKSSTLLPSPTSHVKDDSMGATPCSRAEASWTDNNNVLRQRPVIPPMNGMLPNEESAEGKIGKQIRNNNDFNNDINVGKAPFANAIISEYSACPTVASNQKCARHETRDMDARSCAKVQETAAEGNEVPSAETSLYRDTVELSRSAGCGRLATSAGDKSNMPLSGGSLKISKGKCIVTVKNTESGKIITSLRSAYKVDKNLSRDKSHNNGRTSFNSSEVSGDKNNSLQTRSDLAPKSQAPEIKTQNVMTVIPGNKTLSFNRSPVLESGAPVASLSIKNVANDRSCGTVKHNVTHANVRSDGQNENLPQRNLLDRLNVIKRAMNSVEDNELREQALKALADCGIGIEKHVPIRPPEGHKAVHDTQVQTAVFGLLDPKYFILITKDLENVHRLNQITLHDMPGERLADESHFNDDTAFKDPNVGRESPFDFDSFIEQFWKEDSDALKMRETLSMTRIRCNNLLEQLQKDFERVGQYDQDGMLNIHKAVMSDNVNLVRRQLMVLEHCKQNVDILTEDGATSLELAIKYDVRNEIVKLLLDAGAQPALPRSIHESAVIIASKKSSPLLPILIDRVYDSKLLDQIDADGFAAIHYCGIRGNLQGIKALITAGATIDLKDMKSGRTSLFHAIDNNHTSVMQVLLKAGAVANIANYAGQTALSVMTDPKSLAFKITLRKDR